MGFIKKLINAFLHPNTQPILWGYSVSPYFADGERCFLKHLPSDDESSHEVGMRTLDFYDQQVAKRKAEVSFSQRIIDRINPPHYPFEFYFDKDNIKAVYILNATAEWVRYKVIFNDNKYLILFVFTIAERSRSTGRSQTTTGPTGNRTTNTTVQTVTTRDMDHGWLDFEKFVAGKIKYIGVGEEYVATDEPIIEHRCPHCNELIDKDSVFCGYCGKKVK